MNRLFEAIDVLGTFILTESSEISPEEIVKDSYEHIVSDLGKEVTIDVIFDDITNNYDQEYFKDDTPEHTTQATSDIRYYLRHLGLDYIDESENLNESNISSYSLNNDDPDDVYISCNIDIYDDSLLCIIPCLYDEETGEVKPSKRDINFIDDEGNEVYPDINYDEIIDNIPKDILDSLK